MESWRFRCDTVMDWNCCIGLNHRGSNCYYMYVCDSIEYNIEALFFLYKQRVWEIISPLFYISLLTFCPFRDKRSPLFLLFLQTYILVCQCLQWILYAELIYASVFFTLCQNLSKQNQDPLTQRKACLFHRIKGVHNQYYFPVKIFSEQVCFLYIQLKTQCFIFKILCFLYLLLWKWHLRSWLINVFFVLNAASK